MATQPILTTYSFWNSYRQCPRACAWRYVEELAPLERSLTLRFGTLVHQCLECWHQRRDLAETLELIERACAAQQQSPEVQAARHLATAMLLGYAMRYPEEPFRVVALEKTFEGPLYNPETGKPSRTFVLAGKVDGIVEQDGALFLLEHKTAATLDGAYLEKLWMDFQILLYAYALERYLDLRIAGVIYNILVKAKLRQGQGETEAEFRQRVAELSAKNKSGKSTAQRKYPESDADFQGRLRAKYAEAGMFHRETIYFSREQRAEVEAELWLLAQQFLQARRHGWFFRNTGHCFHYGAPCAYYPLCRANGAEHLIANLYERRPPHEELQPAQDADPVF
jgi:hypothetical protein